MQHLRKLFFLLTIITCTISCKRPDSLNNLEDRHALETAIAHGIKIPFTGTDTIFLMPTQHLLCMNPLPDESFLHRVYISQLDSSIYLHELSGRLTLPVLIWSDSLRIKMDSIAQRKIRVDRGNATEDFRFYMNKAFLTLNGTVLSNDSLKILEQYWNQEKSLTIEKLFIYDGKHWSSVILKETQRKRN